MQIIQSLLGTQINPLGQKSHLGHHISLQSNTNYLHQRNSNLLKPLVIAKALFPASKLFLARKRQPFIDTLIADGYDLDISDADIDFSGIGLEPFNFSLEANNSDKSTDKKASISNESNFIQSQIADKISDEILTKTLAQTETQTNKKEKSQTKKSSQSKSANKTQGKQVTKSSPSKRKTKAFDKNIILPNTNNVQADIVDTLALKANNNEINITNNIFENTLNLQEKTAGDKSSIINDVFANAGNGERQKTLNKNIELDIKIGNSLGYLALESESTNGSEDIDTTNRITNQKHNIANERPGNIDDGNIPIHLKDLQAQAESAIIMQPKTVTQTNENPEKLIVVKTEANTLQIQNYGNEIIEDVSNTQLDINQSLPLLNDSTNNKYIDIKPIPSETILPMFEDKSNSFIHLDKNQKEPIEPNVNYFETEAASASKEVVSQDTVNSPQTVNINNLSPASINYEHVESNSTLPSIENQTTANQAITKPDITLITSSGNTEYITPEEANTQVEVTSFNEVQENIASLKPIQPNATLPTTPKIEKINTTESSITKPIATSFISPKSEKILTQESTPVQPQINSSTTPEIEDINVTTLPTITPVDTSHISLQSEEIYTAGITPVQPQINLLATPEIEDTNTTTLPINTPVAKSHISLQSEEISTPEITPVQPQINLSTSPEIEDNNTTIFPTITPVTTSYISLQFEEISTLNSDTVTPETTDTALTNPAEDLLIVHRIINNETSIPLGSGLVFNNHDLSNLINDSDTSKNTFSSGNIDNTANIDIKPTAILNDLPVPKGYATGGQVTATSVENHQPVAPSDTVPAMLTPGEFVINAKAAQANLQILQHINTGGSAEEVISPSLEVITPQTPEANSLEPTTKVDSFVETPIQRQTAETDTYTEPTPLSSASLGVEIGKQRRSLLSHPQDTIENTTHVSPESSPQYSSPSLIFRKANSTTNTQTPSQWSSVEELLNANNDEFTNFNFGGVEGNWQNSPSSQFASSSTPTHISTKRFSQPQGYANAGEVIAPDISRDIAPITETIQSPDSSSSTEANDDNEDGEIEALAQAIYYRLRQRIEIEKERQGIYVGRLPW